MTEHFRGINIRIVLMKIDKLYNLHTPFICVIHLDPVVSLISNIHILYVINTSKRHDGLTSRNLYLTGGESLISK